MTTKYIGQMENEYGQMMELWTVDGLIVSRPVRAPDREDEDDSGDGTTNWQHDVLLDEQEQEQQTFLCREEEEWNEGCSREADSVI